MSLNSGIRPQQLITQRPRIIVGRRGGGGTTADYSNAIPGGALMPSPAYYQVSGEAAVQLDAAADWVAVRCCSPIDFELTALALRFGAESVQGDITPEIYSDSTAPEPDGAYNDGTTRCHAVMTSDVLPSPLVVTATGEFNASYAKWKAFDGTTSPWYNNVDPSITPQSIAIDLGSGNATIVNKYGIQAHTHSWPEDHTVWGSNLASPDVDTDGNWTQIHSESSVASPGDEGWTWFTFSNSVAYRHYRVKATSSVGSTTHIAMRQLILVEAKSEPAPGSSLQVMDVINSGGAGAAWVRQAIAAGNQYQIQRNKLFWIVFKGEAVTDVSLSCRRVNTVVGSMFPSTLLCAKTTADSGTTWTRLLQDSRDAMLNFIMNPTPHNCPTLIYGRCSGSGVYNGTSLLDIPIEGISLNCEALTVVDACTDPPYYVYVSDDNSDGEADLLTASTTGPTLTSDGIEVMTGATTKRLVGMLGPKEIQTSYQGPVDCPDQRLVENVWNQDTKTVAKANPYSDITSRVIATDTTEKLNNGDDFVCEVMTRNRDLTASGAGLHHTSGGCGLAFGIDAVELHPLSAKVGAAAPGNTQISIQLSDGYHYIVPVIKNVSGGNVTYHLWYDSNAVQTRFQVMGQLTRR